MYYIELDEEQYNDSENMASDFVFRGCGFYDGDGIWHDPEVEDEQEE